MERKREFGFEPEIDEGSDGRLTVEMDQGQASRGSLSRKWLSRDGCRGCRYVLQLCGMGVGMGATVKGMGGLETKGPGVGHGVLRKLWGFLSGKDVFPCLGGDVVRFR
jgi:hypothetical protein